MENIIGEQERKWGMICHLSAFVFFIFPFGNILAPLIVWILKKDKYPYVDVNGREVLNFQISVTIYLMISIILMAVLIGFLLFAAVIITNFILVVIAGAKAKEGIVYRYPFTFRVLS
ncbi:MAG: DUF4870 domain-containing protein [Ignavibacteriae bacterium HGW-Ignavibacteriae-2]|jgi:hypothetical protein|nr:DUF4870 domain-containing protein [Bacteroidota bacterium]PKL88522.1 MAG: DUF4870 domain-containing protein [Ignavibacteriae bacterium HGW-Ignavibacteriae-2]